MNARVDVRQWLGDERFMYGNGTESRAKCEEVFSAVSDLASVAFAVVASGGSDAQLIERLKRSLEDGGFVRIDRVGGTA